MFHSTHLHIFIKFTTRWRIKYNRVEEEEEEEGGSVRKGVEEGNEGGGYLKEACF